VARFLFGLLRLAALALLALLRVRQSPTVSTRPSLEEEAARAERERRKRFERMTPNERAVDQAAAESRLGRSAPALAGLALIAALVPARQVWAAQLLQLLLLLTVPGALLLRALRVRRRAVAAFPLYVPCASLVVLVAAALAVDLLGPPFGLSEPLETLPLLVSLEAIGLALALVAATAPRDAGVPWSALSVRPRMAYPLLLPLTAAAGAVLFTNGHGRALAVVAVSAAVVALALGVLMAGRWSPAQLSLLLFGAGLALVWSFTLRGRFLYGFDIATEIQVVDFTFTEGIWRTAHPDDAYGAMLSLTVLPALLQGLTGISGLLLLKAFYPALLALFPVGVFAFARRVVPVRFAFVVAALLASQAYFFQHLPGIARQEVALLIYVALIAAVLDRRLQRPAHLTLVTLLACGVVVSHYATTYLAIATLAGAVVLQLLLSFFRPIARTSAPLVVALVATVAAAGLWYGAVTHSTANLEQFAQNVRDRGPDLLPNARPGQSLIQAYLQGNAPTRISAMEYESEARQEYRRTRPYVKPWVEAWASQYQLRDASVPADRERVAPLVDLSQILRILGGQLVNVLAVAGALMLVLTRRSTTLARQIGLLALGTLGVLVFVRLSGTAADAYNQERAYLQTMVALGVGLAFALQLVSRRWPRAVGVSAALVVLVIAFTSSGLRGVALGGPTPANLASAGEDFERFFVDPAELAGARWLYQVPESKLVYADRYGQLRVRAATGRDRGLLEELTPKTLDRDAWVYASRTNLKDGRARGSLGGRFAVYHWPAAFIREKYDLVYTNGSSAVYLGDLAGRDMP
jgi:uncharacterized membrane protein